MTYLWYRLRMWLFTHRIMAVLFAPNGNISGSSGTRQTKGKIRPRQTPYQILKMASVRVGRWMYCSAAAYSMVARHCDNLCADVVLFGIWVKQQVTIVTHRLSRPDQHAILSRIWGLVLERALIISPF